MLQADKDQVYQHSSILPSKCWAAGLPFSNLQRNEFEVLFELCDKGPPLKRMHYWALPWNTSSRDAVLFSQEISFEGSWLDSYA
jgi:hypothetical protein